MPLTTVCLVQARLGSSRLPGKVLLSLAGRPLLAHVLERARAIPGVDGVVLATSVAPQDDAVSALAVREGVQVVRGSERDVLGRLAIAARLAQTEYVVRVTGDCPLLAPEIGALVLQTAQRYGAYAWNDTMASGYPDGTDVEAMPCAMLIDADLAARDDPDREHVTPWIRRHRPVVVIRPPDGQSWAWLKLSVDTREDFDRVAQIAERLTPGQHTLSETLAAAELAGFVAPAIGGQP